MEGESDKMITAKTYKDTIISLIDTLVDSQAENIEKTACAMAQCIKNDGVIHVFGSGHSTGLAMDISKRVGCLVPIHICDPSDCVTFGKISLDDFKDKNNIFERRPGVAQFVYDLYDIRPSDIFFVISNSGINGIGIDFAMLAKQKGHKVIVITSMEHTLAEQSRHPSGKKLYMLGDIVLDNCGPHGDALLPTEGVEKVAAVSSICNNIIAQSSAARTIELLQAEGYPVPVLTGDPVVDEALKQQYKGRI